MFNPCPSMNSKETDLGNGVEDRKSEVFLSSLSGRNSSDHSRSVLDGLPGVEGALLAGEPLADDLGVLRQDHVHVRLRVAGADLAG